MIINIYSKDTLEIIGRPVISSLEDFEKNPNLFFPDFNKENHIISEIEYQNPILERGKLREMTKEELYAVGRYTLADNEMIENDKIITVNLSEFEYIEDNALSLMKQITTGKKLNLAQVMTEFMATEYENWKFYTEDNSEKYVNVSVQKFIEMSEIMRKHTTASMVTETTLSHSLLTKSVEELKKFKAEEEYNKLFENEIRR